MTADAHRIPSRLLAAFTASLLVFGVLALHPLPAHAAPPPALAGDFNGDGFVDLAVGAPKQDYTGIKNAGGVSVIYGSAGGLSSTSPIANQFWTENSAGMAGTSENGDQMGLAVAVGDFNGDGFSDLAAGMPGKSLGAKTRAGAVNVIYGSATGLDPAGAVGNQVWTLDSPVIPGTARAGDAFGRSLASGDFNGDGIADLAIGAPTKSGHAPAAGAALVIYGSGSGLTSTGSQLLSQKTPGVPGTPENTDIFGWDVAAGAFDGSSHDGLAIGVPLESMPGVGASGVVDVVYGSGSGLTGTGAQSWNQNTAGVPGIAMDGDAFGASIAAGDFGSGSATDLVVGVAADTIHGRPAAGSVNVLYGSGSGLTSAGAQLWDQASPGILDNAEPGDLFGADVATGDFNGDGHADLSVAATYEDVGSLVDAGAAAVVYADSGGARLAAAGNQLWTQDSPGMQNVARSNDQFAYSLA